MPRKKPKVFSMKVPLDFNERLESGATLTKLPKATLALAAIDAVLAAIERDRGLVVPVGFALRFEPTSKPTLVYPEREDSTSKVAEAARQALRDKAGQEDRTPAGKASPPQHK